MNIRQAFFVALLYLLSSSSSVFAQSKKISAEEILRAVSKKLESLKTLRYAYRRELNYASEGYVGEFGANAFLEFDSANQMVGAKYQFENDQSLLVYNGSEVFELNKRGKTIRVRANPAPDYFLSSTPLYDSLITLKNALPKIYADKTIPKSYWEQDASYVVEFVLGKKTLGNLGNYSALTSDRKILYRLTIRKDDYLPTEVFRGNNVNKDFSKTIFTNLAANVVAPMEDTWYYSTYLGEYKYQQPLEDLLIKTGAVAPEWTLPVISTSAQYSLSQFKNKLVMVEFWISFCGYSIAAVPKLNAIAEKYKDKDFKLIGVNAHDSEAVIQIFQKNHQPRFEILYDGQKTADLYGVRAFPTIVLVGKDGRVIYSGPLDSEKIEAIISQNL